MWWIVCALLICIFMAFFTLRVLSFEPFKFMDYTPKEFYEYEKSGLCAIVRGTACCIRVVYIVIGTVLGLVLCDFLHNSFIKVLTGMGGGIVIVGTALAVVGVFVLIEMCFEKIINFIGDTV